MEDLVFKQSMSIQQFKDSIGATQIEVVRNPNTEKLFFITDTGHQGMVSTKADLQSDALQVALVEANGEEAWMLCKKQTDNVVATF